MYSGLLVFLLLIRMADDVLTFEFGHSFVIKEKETIDFIVS